MVAADATGGQPALERLVLSVPGNQESCALAQRLLNTIEDGGEAVESLTRLVVTDKSLAGRLRHVASTEAASLAHPIPTARHAIHALGFRAVHSTALACTFIDMLQGDCSNLHYITFWRHGVAVAMLAQVLAVVEQRHRDEAFAAGALHNVGRLILDQHAPAALDAARRYAGSEGLPVSAAVRALVGFGEEEICSAIAAQWDLPATIIEALGTWGDDGAISDPGLHGVVARAATYAGRIGISDGIEAPPASGPAVDEALAPLETAMGHIGGVDWLHSRVDKIIEAALLA